MRAEVRRREHRCRHSASLLAPRKRCRAAADTHMAMGDSVEYNELLPPSYICAGCSAQGSALQLNARLKLAAIVKDVDRRSDQIRA